MHADIMLGLIEDLREGLHVVETRIGRTDQPAEHRAELRGREAAYRSTIDRAKKALCQMDRLGRGSSVEAAIAHIEAAERLVAEVSAGGYKSEYSKGFCKDSLTATKRALIGLWNVIKE